MTARRPTRVYTVCPDALVPPPGGQDVGRSSAFVFQRWSSSLRRSALGAARDVETIGWRFEHRRRTHRTRFFWGVSRASRWLSTARISWRRSAAEISLGERCCIFAPRGGCDGERKSELCLFLALADFDRSSATPRSTACEAPLEPTLRQLPDVALRASPALAQAQSRPMSSDVGHRERVRVKALLRRSCRRVVSVLSLARGGGPAWYGWYLCVGPALEKFY